METKEEKSDILEYKLINFLKKKLVDISYNYSFVCKVGVRNFVYARLGHSKFNC